MWKTETVEEICNAQNAENGKQQTLRLQSIFV